MPIWNMLELCSTLIVMLYSKRFSLHFFYLNRDKGPGKRCFFKISRAESRVSWCIYQPNRRKLVIHSPCCMQWRWSLMATAKEKGQPRRSCSWSLFIHDKSIVGRRLLTWSSCREWADGDGIQIICSVCVKWRTRNVGIAEVFVASVHSLCFFNIFPIDGLMSNIFENQNLCKFFSIKVAMKVLLAHDADGTCESQKCHGKYWQISTIFSSLIFYASNLPLYLDMIYPPAEVQLATCVS